MVENFNYKDENLISSSDLMVDTTAQSDLKETGMWARFLGIAGIALSVLLAVIGLFSSAIIGSLPNASYLSGLGIVSTLIYLALAGVAFFAALKCYKFGTNARLALETNDQGAINAAFQNLKVLFRIYGIFLIIYLGFVLIAIFGWVIMYFSMGR